MKLTRYEVASCWLFEVAEQGAAAAAQGEATNMAFCTKLPISQGGARCFPVSSPRTLAATHSYRVPGKTVNAPACGGRTEERKKKACHRREDPFVLLFSSGEAGGRVDCTIYLTMVRVWHKVSGSSGLNACSSPPLLSPFHPKPAPGSRERVGNLPGSAGTSARVTTYDHDCPNARLRYGVRAASAKGEFPKKEHPRDRWMEARGGGPGL